MSASRRVLQAVRLDARVQARNNLWAISAGVGVPAALALAWLTPTDQIGGTLPMAVLLLAGGSTLLYVTAMILMERSDGTLSAIAVSPLRDWEYLSAKVLTLTGMCALEAVILCYGALALLARTGPVTWPGPAFWPGVLALGVMHVLVGVILVVRFDRINDVLLPMGGIALVFQIPALWVVGAIDHPWVMAIPTSAPVLIVKAGFASLTAGQWIYALTYTAVTIVVLGVWSVRAFHRHVIERGG